MLQHLSELFALIVGRLDECPDAINTAWIRLVTPREGDTNRSCWDTDALWRVVQSPTFTGAPASARRLIRRRQRSHNVDKLVSTEYGYLVSYTAAQFRDGEQWDVSRAIGELTRAVVKESEKPKKDFGELVRERRKARGLSVLQHEPILPPSPAAQTLTPPPVIVPVLAAPPALGLAYHDVELAGMAHTRATLAEVRVQQAYQALEEAEVHMRPMAEVEQLERHYHQELVTFVATRGLHNAPAPSRGSRPPYPEP